MPRTAFYLACMQTNPDQVGDYIAEAKQMGIAICAPHINMSAVQTATNGSDIYFGFHNVKGVGKDASRYLTRLRDKHGPFKGRQHVEGLIDDACIFWEHGGKRGKSPRQICGEGALNALDNAGCFDTLDGCPDPRQRSQLQRELLGISFVDLYTPLLERFANEIHDCKPFPELVDTDLGVGYGILSAMEIRRTSSKARKGFADKEYAVLSLEWEQAIGKLTCFDLDEHAADLEIGSFWKVVARFGPKGATMRAGRRLE